MKNIVALPAALCLTLSCALAAPAHAAPLSYTVTFHAATGQSGTGSFLWDADTQQMTGFNWLFPEGAGEFLDSGLARKIYSPGSARSVGALLFHLFTDPVAYWSSTHGLRGVEMGYFTTHFASWGDVVTSAPTDMFAVSYRHDALVSRYEMLALGPRTVLASGSVTAVPTRPIPEPASLALLLAGLGVFGASGLMARRRR